MEYQGDLITSTEDKSRERSMTSSCGVFYIILNIRQLYTLHVITMSCSIHSNEAAKERLSIAWLINHSRTSLYLIPKVIGLDGKPQLYFIAAKEIKEKELLYNYGETKEGHGQI